MAGPHPDEQRLNDLVYGRLTGAANDDVVAHLEGCARCREVIVELGRDRSKEVAAVPGGGGDPLIGTRLGEYLVLERLSTGGMGQLYRGEQPEIGKRVAIKVLLPEAAEEPDLVNRLLAEARAVNAIRHPNIIDIFSFGRVPDGRHYFVMELLEGESLHARIRRGPLQPVEALEVLEQAAAALEAAHAVNVVHRDIKPGNLFITRRTDGALHVTLLDFGIAKNLGIRGETAPNIVLGTPGFMAPEQQQGLPVSVASDIYALGVVAYQMLSGRSPWAEQDTRAIAFAQRDQEPVRLGSIAFVPRPLETLIERMMARAPADRPTAPEVRRSIAKVKKEGIETVKVVTPLMAIDALRKPRPDAMPAPGPEAHAATYVPGARATEVELPSRQKETLNLVGVAQRTVTDAPAATAAMTTIPDRAVSQFGPMVTMVDAEPPARRPWLWMLGALFATLAVGGLAWWLISGR